MMAVTFTALGAVTAVMFTALAFSPQAEAAGDGSMLDMRLMAEADIAPAARCGLRLWQRERNPDADTFAYAFAMIVAEGQAGDGLIKIGKQIERVTPIAAGGQAFGPIHQVQVLRKPDSPLTIIIDLMEFADAGDGLEVYDGRITVYDSNKPPFPVRVAGGYACAAQAATQAEVAAVDLKKIQDINGWKQVPPEILSDVRESQDCDHDSLSVVWGSVYQVAENRRIWEIPCFLGAYQGAMVFMYQITDQPDSFWRMTFQTPPGPGTKTQQEQNPAAEQAWLMEPRLNAATGIVTSLELGRAAADCGKYQRHRLVPDGDGAHRFELIEYREKPVCDEVFIPVEDFPLLYPKPGQVPK